MYHILHLYNMHRLVTEGLCQHHDCRKLTRVNCWVTNYLSWLEEMRSRNAARAFIKWRH